MNTATLVRVDQTRQVSLRAESVNGAGRSLQAVIATDTPTEVYDFRSGQVVLESLHMAGVKTPAQTPLLLDHARMVATTVGSVIGFRVEGGKLRAMMRFASGVDRANDAWELVSQGHLRDCSIGYRILDTEEFRPGESKTIGGKTYTAPRNRPLRVVTVWQLKEVSLVPIGADSESGIGKRSAVSGDSTMSIVDVIGPEARMMRLPQIWAAEMRSRGERVPENDDAIVQRSLETESTAMELAGLVNTAVLTGFRTAADSTAGWARTVPLPNFLSAKIAAVTTAPRLGQLSRGRTASHVGFAVTNEGWGLARFASKFEMDETTIVSSPFDVFAVALEEVGAAARRLVPDLVYSLLLTNGAMADGTAVFDATRGNYQTGALAAATLGVGMGAIGNQLLTDTGGDPVHRNLRARYLTIAPEVEREAKAIVRDMSTGEGDLIVRPESRLSTGGVVNPLNESILTANGTNWLLSCASDRAAGVVIGSLNGRMEPSVRHYNLIEGKWGIGFDIVFDLAAQVLTPEALYWSTGAA